MGAAAGRYSSLSSKKSTVASSWENLSNYFGALLHGEMSFAVARHAKMIPIKSGENNTEWNKTQLFGL